MSGLTKKIIYADKLLSSLLGVQEGSLVSYSEISKGLHKYIKKNDLKNPDSVKLQPPSTQPPLPPEAALTRMEEATVCKDCGEPLPLGAVFCDMCGVKQ